MRLRPRDDTTAAIGEGGSSTASTRAQIASPYMTLPPDFACPPGAIVSGRFCTSRGLGQWPSGNFLIICHYPPMHEDTHFRPRFATQVKHKCPEDRICRKWPFRPDRGTATSPADAATQVASSSAAGPDLDRELQLDGLHGKIDCVPRHAIDWAEIRAYAKQSKNRWRARGGQTARERARARAEEQAAEERQRAIDASRTRPSQARETPSEIDDPYSADRSWPFGFTPDPGPERPGDSSRGHPPRS